MSGDLKSGFKCIGIVMFHIMKAYYLTGHCTSIVKVATILYVKALWVVGYNNERQWTIENSFRKNKPQTNKHCWVPFQKASHKALLFSMTVGTAEARGGVSLTLKAGGLSPPQKKWSLSLEVNTCFNGLQSYTCLTPMIMIKLTSKVQKNMFERAKNRKKFLGGVSPGPLAALAPSPLEEPPNFFHLPTALLFRLVFIQKHSFDSCRTTYSY